MSLALLHIHCKACKSHHFMYNTKFMIRQVHYCTSHCNDFRIGAMASQITGVSIVWSTVCSGAEQQQQQQKIKAPRHWGESMDSNNKGPVTRRMLPFDDVIMVITVPADVVQNLSCLHHNISAYRWFCVTLLDLTTSSQVADMSSRNITTLRLLVHQIAILMCLKWAWWSTNTHLRLKQCKLQITMQLAYIVTPLDFVEYHWSLFLKNKQPAGFRFCTERAN